MVIHPGYVTLVWSLMHWSSQKGLEDLIIGTNVMHHLSVRPLYILKTFGTLVEFDT